MICIGDVVYTTYRKYLMPLKRDRKLATEIVDDLDNATCMRIACVREVRKSSENLLESSLKARYVLLIVAQGQSVVAVNVSNSKTSHDWRKGDKHRSETHHLTIEHLRAVLQKQYDRFSSSFDLSDTMSVINNSVFTKINISADSRRMIALLDRGWAVSCCLDLQGNKNVGKSVFKHLYLFNVNLPGCVSSVLLPFQSTTVHNTPSVLMFAQKNPQGIPYEVKYDEDDDEYDCCECEILTYTENGELGKDNILFVASSDRDAPCKVSQPSRFLTSSSKAIKTVYFPQPFRDCLDIDDNDCTIIDGGNAIELEPNKARIPFPHPRIQGKAGKASSSMSQDRIIGYVKSEVHKKNDESKDSVQVFYTIDKWSHQSRSIVSRLFALTDGDVRGKITRWLVKTSRVQMIYRRPRFFPNIIFPLIGFFLEMAALVSTSFVEEFVWNREVDSRARKVMLFFQFGGVEEEIAELVMACVSILLITFIVYSYHQYDHSKRLKVESSSGSFAYSAAVTFGSGVGLSYLTTWLLLPLKCPENKGITSSEKNVFNCHKSTHYIVWLIPILLLLPVFWYISIRAKKSDGVAGIQKNHRWPNIFRLCGKTSESEKKLPFTGTGWTLFVSSTRPSHTRSYAVIFTVVRIVNVLIAILFLSESKVVALSILLLSIFVCITAAIWELPYATPLANTIALSSLTVIAYTNATALAAELFASGEDSRDRLRLIVFIYVLCAPTLFLVSMWGYAQVTYRKTETLLDNRHKYLPRATDWYRGTFVEKKAKK